jgi:hypothetical protein
MVYTKIKIGNKIKRKKNVGTTVEYLYKFFLWSISEAKKIFQIGNENINNRVTLATNPPFSKILSVKPIIGHIGAKKPLHSCA